MRKKYWFNVRGSFSREYNQAGFIGLTVVHTSKAGFLSSFELVGCDVDKEYPISYLNRSERFIVR